MFWEIWGLSTKSGFFLSHERKLLRKLISPNEAKNTQIIACWYITYIQRNKKKREKREKQFSQAGRVGIRINLVHYFNFSSLLRKYCNVFLLRKYCTEHYLLEKLAKCITFGGVTFVIVTEFFLVCVLQKFALDFFLQRRYDCNFTYRHSSILYLVIRRICDFMF